MEAVVIYTADYVTNILSPWNGDSVMCLLCQSDLFWHITGYQLYIKHEWFSCDRLRIQSLVCKTEAIWFYWLLVMDPFCMGCAIEVIRCLCLHYLNNSKVTEIANLRQHITAQASQIRVCVFLVAFAITVQRRYNTVNFLRNHHTRTPIPRPWGQRMGCLLWLLTLIYVLLQSLLCRVQNHTLLDHVITATDCI